MLLFCSMMHFASGVFAWGFCLEETPKQKRCFCGFLRVRRKTSQFVLQKRCVFQKISSNRTGCSQICVSPDLHEHASPVGAGVFAWGV